MATADHGAPQNLQRKRVVYECDKCTEELKRLGIDTTTDTMNTHPPYLCNTCYATAKKYLVERQKPQELPPSCGYLTLTVGAR